MRILVVSNLFPPIVVGGYELECEGVVLRLRERHEVLVLTSRQGPPEPGVLRVLPFLRHRKRDSLRAPLAALRAARHARQALHAFRPDLVFVWNGSQIPHSALWVLNTAGVPLAYRVCEHWFGRLYTGDTFMRHLTPGERGLRGMWARAMRLINRHPALRLDPTARAPAALSWCSDFLRAATPVPPALQPTHQETCFTSTEHTAAFAGVPRRPDPDDPLIVFVGRLDERKGAHVAIEALARMPEPRPRLVLVGAGEASVLGTDRLRAARQEPGVAPLGDRVQTTGPLTGPALHDLVARAHAWVIPSVWDEPMGLVALEAALARVPAVIARAGGLPELLADGEHALFFDRGDAAGCAAALSATLNDPAAARARADRAFQRASAITGEPYLAAMEAFVEAAVTPRPAPAR